MSNIVIEGKSKTKFITMNNGLKMPLVGLGSWQSDNPEEIELALEKALEAGYRHFDTATLYKNEDSLGKVFRRWLDQGKVKREELFIVTKLPWNAMRPDLVEKFLKSSLARLQVKYVDLYLTHWPIGLIYTSDDDLIPMKDGKIMYDKTTDIEAVWKAMEAQVDAGLAKSIGISNYNIKQVERIMKMARIPPANQQVEVQTYFQNKALRQVCEKYNISVCAYGPLGSPGRKTYSFTGIEFNIPDLMDDPVVKDIAKKHSKTPGQILLKFLVQQNIAVIPKSTNPERLKMNINIFDFELTQVDMRRLEGLDKGEAGRSFPGFTE
ncbi:Alcohol dehydrogenase [NADP(+)] A [Folsomia candida]|uniref:Alcohol dehydrogenase [NADP(+)] A n=1 Tax=Folsomia candida TaxID=158441 RepID=A0A226D846_FOLCA|nr:Alcohol dehydrogenase [NADP(+)] A [Folsomia candida]